VVIFTDEAVIPAIVESLPAPPFEDSTPSSYTSLKKTFGLGVKLVTMYERIYRGV